MKRSLSLIVLAAICVLALAAVTSLSGCSTKAPDNDPTGSIDSPDPAPAVTGETATYTSGYVDMALTIPEGWQWEAVQRSGTTTEGIRFWKTDDKALDFELLCWRNGYGICGTDVTSEELTLSGGQKVWQHTEESDDGLWLNLYFESVPGDYVCQFADSVLDKAVWEAGRDEVLAILGTAQFGRDAMTEQAPSMPPRLSTTASTTWPMAATAWSTAAGRSPSPRARREKTARASRSRLRAA